MRSSDLRVVPLALAQLDQMILLRLALAREAKERLDEIDGWPERFVRFFHDRQLRGESQTFAVFRDDEIVAMATASLVRDYRAHAFREQSGYINALYVRPEYRRRGLATELVRAAISWLTKSGCTIVRLRPSKESAALYRALGFKSSSELELRVGGKIGHRSE